MDAHILKDIDVLTLIPEYDEDGQFSNLVIVPEVGISLRIRPVLNRTGQMLYLEVEEEETEG